jgi:hypothetical protein
VGEKFDRSWHRNPMISWTIGLGAKDGFHDARVAGKYLFILLEHAEN